MPEVTIENESISAPRVHGWTGLLHRTTPGGPWRMDSVFESPFAAGLWAGTMLGNGMAVQVKRVEIRLAPEKGEG